MPAERKRHEARSHHRLEAPALAAFVDVETTGLSPRRDQILELAVVLFTFDPASGEIGQVLDRYTGQQEPTVPIHPGALRVHGITFESVQGKQLDRVRVEALFHQAHLLLAHNARFDHGFVSRLFPTAAARPWYCSMRGIDWPRRGFPTRRLQDLLRAHGIQPERAHRADADVEAAIALLQQRDAAGQPYFRELIHGSPLIPGTAAESEAGAGD